MTAVGDPRTQTIGVLGSGAAGLITAYTLIQDGFVNVQIISRDSSPGGVWSKERVYPGLSINNVHGEYRFSSLTMKSPSNSAATGGRLTGDDMQEYMETFADTFLKGKFRFNTEVLEIRRECDTSGKWILDIRDTRSRSREIIRFSKIVLCSGGTSVPKIPEALSLAAAEKAGFRGLVLHPVTFRTDLTRMLARAKPLDHDKHGGTVVIVGCGKSAQDHAAYLATNGCRVTVVYELTDAFVAAGKKPLPDFLRKSRFLSLLSPNIELNTTLEWFMHKTWLGSTITKHIWNKISTNAFKTFGIPLDSPLRRARSPFWAIRSNDEGVARPNSFHSLTMAGKIQVISPARVEGFTEDGNGVLLNNGSRLSAEVLIVATGYASSWEGIFDEATAKNLGINKISIKNSYNHEWDYLTLMDPPPKHRESSKYFLPIYRGIVPAVNINRRDFAINGAVITSNNGYAFEVAAHWISSYFLGDKMHLPQPDEALAHSERNAFWLQKRYPYVNLWENPSISSGIAFWNWPQAIDSLLEDMGLRTRRSGGNWLTWPFQVVDIKEIANLREERRAKRDPYNGRLY